MIGYLYRCEKCGYEERLKSLYRGFACKDCKQAVMKVVDETDKQ